MAKERLEAVKWGSKSLHNSKSQRIRDESLPPSGKLKTLGLSSGSIHVADNSGNPSSWRHLTGDLCLHFLDSRGPQLERSSPPPLAFGTA